MLTFAARDGGRRGPTELVRRLSCALDAGVQDAFIEFLQTGGLDATIVRSDVRLGDTEPEESE